MILFTQGLENWPGLDAERTTEENVNTIRCIGTIKINFPHSRYSYSKPEKILKSQRNLQLFTLSKRQNSWHQVQRPPPYSSRRCGILKFPVNFRLIRQNIVRSDKYKFAVNQLIRPSQRLFCVIAGRFQTLLLHWPTKLSPR